MSLRHTTLWLIILLGAALLSQALAAPFPLDALTPGLQGHGLTAGAGNTVERFDVEVLALQSDVGLGFPLVLVRTSGPVIEAAGGVAAGMSGSPVYLEHQGQERLLGAIGYVFPSSDHKLALVTPFVFMQQLSPQVNYTPFGETLFAELGERAPVATPILMSGLSERASQPLSGLFRNSSVSPMPVQLAGTGGFDEAAYQLEPGSAISVQLARGDVTIAGVGTVTAIEDDVIYAFGHPFLGQGRVSFALTPAYITYIVPSSVVPFKLANNGMTVLGDITEDRPAAIAGRLGGEPDFIPVTLSVSGALGSHSKSFEVTSDERYYTSLLASGMLQLLDDIKGEISGGTARLAWQISLSDGSTVRLLEQVTSPSDIAVLTAGLAAEPLSILANNTFRAPDVSAVSMTLELSDTQDYAEIVEVALENESLSPGDTIVAHVRLQPFRGAPTVRTFRVQLPTDESGIYDVVFRGGRGFEAGPSNSEGSPILSFGELITVLQDQVQSQELIIETFMDGETVQLERLTLPFLVQGDKTLTVTVNGDESDLHEFDQELPDDGPEEPRPAPETPFDPLR